MREILFFILFSLSLSPQTATASELEIHSEFQRVDPLGAVLTVDRQAPDETVPEAREAIRIQGARGGYVSFQLVARVPESGAYSLDVQWDQGAGKLDVDLYREWFHFTEREKSYFPDALIPVKIPYRSRLPEPDNKIAGQGAQPFWVDIWIPADAKPGPYTAVATLEAGGKRVSRSVPLDVLAAVIPAQAAVTVDHNSYGTSWLGSQYRALRRRLGASFFASDEFFGLIHAYHRIFYEHLGSFHQLGYGHGGKVSPEFAPALEGSGRTRRIADWSLYDRHYGALLDGTAFTGTKRGPQPIPFVYLPINPEWPASYLWWGEPGYETEFVNVLGQMERHFREKGWTHTVFEIFFNHKKRYKAFPWDGDEARFPKDDQYVLDYGKLAKKALPANTPVQFRIRADASWMMERQFHDLAGVVTFWVVGGDALSWYKGAPDMLRKRGDIIFDYGGTPSVAENSGAVTFAPFECWMWNVEGYVRWLTTSPGSDPWFRSDGGRTALAYPGDRFGIEAPIPCIRLKLQRNCVQDITLLDSFKSSKPLDSLKEQAAHRYNGSRLEDWWPPRPAYADLPGYEMSNRQDDENTQAIQQLARQVDAGSWSQVRSWILQLAQEEK